MCNWFQNKSPTHTFAVDWDTRHGNWAAPCYFNGASPTGSARWGYCLQRHLACEGLYCDVIMMWPLLFHGIRADVSETPGNALTTRMHGDYRPSIDRFFVGFNAICYAFLRNNPIYIEGRNCSFTTVPVLFNKGSGLRPSDTLSSWWLGWRRHAREVNPFFGPPCGRWLPSGRLPDRIA